MAYDTWLNKKMVNQAAKTIQQLEDEIRALNREIAQKKRSIVGLHILPVVVFILAKDNWAGFCPFVFFAGIWILQAIYFDVQILIGNGCPKCKARDEKRHELNDANALYLALQNPVFKRGGSPQQVSKTAQSAPLNTLLDSAKRLRDAGEMSEAEYKALMRLVLYKQD